MLSYSEFANEAGVFVLHKSPIKYAGTACVPSLHILRKDICVFCYPKYFFSFLENCRRGSFWFWASILSRMSSMILFHLAAVRPSFTG